MLYDICYYFILFLIYSMLGWLIEVIRTYTSQHKFVNRGFLIGPYCPIYGIGVLLIINFLQEYMDNFIVLFLLAMLLCMTLEYLTSYIMEVLFNARWWDYSNRKFNINGRICLETAIPFGLCGLVIMYLVNPLLVSILDMIPRMILIILGISLMVIFLVDFVLSFIVILKFKNIKLDKFKDDTEEMNKLVKDYLIKNSRWTKRLVNSFPNFKIKLETLKKIYDKYISKNK